ncbi:MAG: MGMT family protein [Candidatus Thorarchaeota archaeon]|jgi:methylated-DNA-[protein]-cysteine S-methyltransferase
MAQKTVAVLERDGKYVAGIFTEKGLYATSIPRRSEKEALKAVEAKSIQRGDDSQHSAILSKVFMIMQGEKDSDTAKVKLDFSDLTRNQIAVIQALLKIPAGETITYGDLASRAGLPHAARFVGNVMAKNRFAPIVPCHRVISSSGLGGFGFGLKMKKELLAREGGHY